MSVLTGFLGSGKTTLLNHLTGQAALHRTLVLINEFGEVGLDHELVAYSKDEMVVEMSSGCLCCTIRGDLTRTLREAPGRFAREGRLWFDRVVIETTGLADPAPILHTLIADNTIRHRYRLDGVIATIDSVNGEITLDSQLESVKQAAVADRLLLTKADLVDKDLLKRLQQRLRALNPTAPQIIAKYGHVDPSVIFGAGSYDPGSKIPDVQDWLGAETGGTEHRHGHSHHDVNRHDADIKSFCVTTDEPIRRESLTQWLERLAEHRGPDLLRIKGIINVADLDGPVVIHGVQHVVHPPIEFGD
ncbi:MAG: GTP-binding protein, partial [Pseudomonadota bacterium]